MNPTCAVLLVALVGSAFGFPQVKEPVPVPQDGTILISRPSGPLPVELQQNAPVEQEIVPEAEPQNDEPAPAAAVVDPVELAQVNQDQEAVRAKRQFGYGEIDVEIDVVGGGGFNGGGYPGYGGYGGYDEGYGGYGEGYGGYGGYGEFGNRRHHNRG
ncbi:heterogeneous nuclear ribonucleoprotein A2 homolog 1-like [Ochlerotatus camptorhynchus]|uniref:heterogeneous nuclear ribonucleoprotein A2 homolog 1-like n=1 Tax=Ochlerotatus camptorhynchus TaxID=644619 RepID=UPI0031D0466A